MSLSRGSASFPGRRAIFVLWLTLVWVLLWEDYSPAATLTGLVVSATLLALFPGPAPRRFGGVRPVKLMRFAAYFTYKLLEANLIVARKVVTSPIRVNEGVIAVPVRESSDAVVTLIANAISLTPGTLTLEVRRNPTVLYVHVLDLKSVEEARAEILRLERLALEAFGENVDQAPESESAGGRGGSRSGARGGDD